MRSAVSKGGGNSSPAGERERYWRSLNGHEDESRTQPRRTWSHRSAIPGGQGVRREAESEGHEEKCRAVIEGHNPEDEPVGRGWGKVEPAIWRRRRFSFTHQKHGDCGRHGTEEWRVTSGGLAGSPVAPEESDPISARRSGKRCSASSRTAAWCALSSASLRRVEVPLALG